MKTIPTLILACSALLLGACTRIETGEVGLRINFDKTTDPTERLPGSFNQTIIGDILTFKIQDVAVAVDNLTPLASDNSTIKDFDMLVGLGVFNSSIMNDAVFKFRRYEDASLSYSGLEKSLIETKLGLYDTVVTVADSKHLKN